MPTDPTPIRAVMVLVASIGAAGCDDRDGGLSPDADGSAPAIDVRGEDRPPEGRVDAEVPEVVDADPCATSGLAALFEARVRPWLTNCSSCHDMTAPPGVLEAPGPPWYHPTDSEPIVEFLLDNGTVDGRIPERSRLLRKPLSPDDGGVAHTGGVYFGADDPAYDDFVAFLEVASPCVRRGP